MANYNTEFKKNLKVLANYYSFLTMLTKEHKFIGAANEWILDNYYLIIEQEKFLKGFLNNRKCYAEAFSKRINLYDVVYRIMKRNKFLVDDKVLIKGLNLYQDNYNFQFSYNELNSICSVSFVVLINELKNVISREEKNLKDALEAENLIDTIKADINKYHEVDIHNYITIDDEILMRPVYLERLNAGLKELGSLSNEIFKQLNELLDRNHVNLNKLIEDVYEKTAYENILVSNIFNSFVKISRIQAEDLFRKVSKTEYILMLDSYYNNMDFSTKQWYRGRVIKMARKAHMSETDFARKIIAKGTQEEKHIGFYLKEKENYNLRAHVFIGLVILATVIIAFFLSKVFISLRVLGFLILLIPISEVVIEIFSRLWLKIYRPEPIPKLDFTNGIPKSSATMTVIVTIVKSVEKVEKMFDTLETYYLANKSENLYFTLLGDCSSSDHQIEPFDEEVLEAGLNRCKKLNAKYGKNIFYFAYRKRVYNESEEEWLGYERKRGALEHFNRLLLGKLPKEEQNIYYFGHNFDGFDKKIKYVITLDQDTQLVLGSAFNLVGAMAHPLNRPILNSERTKVIDGYGIMQPRVGVDVESTNKSLFTQAYAGIGGFDVYNKLVCNFYQDVFKEGSFWGKGIYDLAIFDELLTGKLPNNRILSHDLLEGNFVRCGFLADVELIDDFPSTYLADATRRHRWARGDMQIASYINPNKTPFNLLERYKIFDNIRRGLVDFSLLLILVLAFLIGKYNPSYWILFVMLVLLLPILFYIKDKIKIQKERTLRVKHYLTIAYGFKAVAIRTLSTFSALPYNAKLYIDAFIRALYRTYVSHKHMLAWITADDAAKNTKNTFLSYVKSFKVNYVFIIIFLVAVYFINHEYFILACSVSLIFAISSILFYLIGKDIRQDPKKLNKKEKEALKETARRTWAFYEMLLIEENNYLVADNYQLNREVKEDIKTSPTNIGFSLMACVSATELGFIKPDEAIDKISHIIESIEQLEKWHGHLYNWYNIKTMEKMFPPTISSVDSGNFVASLIVTKSFVRKYGTENLRNRIENLIRQTNFKYLYNKEEKVFSCGYNTYNEQLIQFNYNKFASEARLTSFVAIAKGDVPKQHWFLLDKTLTTYHGTKGLLSWSGTSFEYFMPLIWMRDYPNTLLDESYHFAYFCQKEYMYKLHPEYPWGISEAAYNLLDDSQNYKYKAFGTPYLKFKDNDEERLVISPYASILAITKFPRQVFNNIQKFKKLNMYGEFGYYESYDCEDETPILSYFAHHQGMILASITNLLTNKSIQNYFHDDIRVQSFDILNKEKVQIEPMIDMKIVKYKKYDYEKELFANDIRSYSYISSRPEVSVLSNSRYCLMLNDRGSGFSRYKTIQLNRYHKITEQEYGNFLYIRDLDSNKVWSNTYAPTNVKPSRYDVVFALDRINYMRVDHDIVTTTEIIVTKRHNAEIRKITFKNASNKDRRLELTTYTEPTICERDADIGHRVFNSMFIKSTFHQETSSIIFNRRIRGTNDRYYSINKLLIDEPLDDYSYETERSNFIRRGTDYRDPSGLHTKLSNYVGENLDPISSIRNRIEIPSGKKVTVYMITGFGKSEEQVLGIVNAYRDETSIEEAYKITTLMVNAATKKLGVTGADIHLYNMMLNYLNQTSRININEERKKLLLENKLGQDTLWSFGISGDRPIILVETTNASSMNLVKELLKAFEYYKGKCQFVDLVIINSDDEASASTIRTMVNDELYHMNAINSFSNIPGRVVLIEREKISDEQLILFRSIARLAFNTEYNNSLREHISKLQSENQINPYTEREYMVSDAIEKDENLVFDNEYGGFTSDGREYKIYNLNTPMSWANVLANPEFGSIITANDNGFTYSDNSREYKVTSWTNDMIIDDKSEGLYINGKLLEWGNCTHGMGYTKFAFKNKEFSLDATYFVPPTDRVKVGLYTLRNTSGSTLELDMSYWINPVLGVTEEKTIRHLVCNNYELNNLLTIQNKYAMNFKDNIVYLTSTDDITKYDTDSVMVKSITTKKVLGPRETQTFAFVLGCEKSIDTIKDMALKYQDLSYIESQYTDTVSHWRGKLDTIQISTPDDSFNFMVNNWLLYQTYASRIMARSGFYQVGGAFGFRDQLQDSMNICVIDPATTKKQILICAKHQFEEGDVLHWWHVENHFGLRSRYKDDYLWLVYATCEYLRITGDKSILEEMIPYTVGDKLYDGEEERGMTFSYSEEEVTLYDHLKLCMDKLFTEIAPNGIPYMGGGDWNDGMNHVGIRGKGTSVWLGFFAYEVVNRFMEVASTNYNEDVEVYKEFNEKLKAALHETWDGEYYLRAYFDNGDKLGSHECEECKIDLISQSWSILTDVALENQIRSIVKSVSENLVDEENGFIKLLTPAFSKSRNNPGYIRDYSIGIRENGGQYTHSVAWWIMALIKLGQNDYAYKHYSMVNPINHSLTKKDVRTYAVEPYVIAADIYSNESFLGHGGWTWYTGSSGWFYKVAIQSILGFNKVGNKLYMLPCAPRKWESYKITYRYMDTTYVINVNNYQKDYEIRLDGKVVKEIELVNDKKKHNINVNIGKGV